MPETIQYSDIGTELSGMVGTVEIRRPPNNFFDVSLIFQIADAFDRFDADPQCRAIVLASQGKAFCAGADFQTRPDLAQTIASAAGSGTGKHLYKEATRLFRAKKPV